MLRSLRISNSITNRTNNIDRFFNDVEKIDMISPQKEIELARRIKNGDKKAEEELITANLRFLISVAKQYQRQDNELSDLINDGSIGLIKAAKRFDETRGFKFISYAVWWIRQSILEESRKNARFIRVPGNKLAWYNKYKDAISYLEQELERHPTKEEICEYMNIDSDFYEQLYSISHSPVSLSKKINDEDSEMIDVIPDQADATDARLEGRDVRDLLLQNMDCLTPKEKRVLILWSGIGQPAPLELKEISVIENRTPERIRQIKNKAIKKMRNSFSDVELSL